MLMKAPPPLAQIDSSVFTAPRACNDIRLVLPTISRNYKTYYQVSEQLNGLQRYVKQLSKQSMTNKDSEQ